MFEGDLELEVRRSRCEGQVPPLAQLDDRTEPRSEVHPIGELEASMEHHVPLNLQLSQQQKRSLVASTPALNGAELFS